MGIREDKFIVRTYECQSNGNIKICALMQYLQEIASVHADELGFGNTWLNEINGYWVLSNIRLEINLLPKWNDEVIIRTWPSGKRYRSIGCAPCCEPVESDARKIDEIIYELENTKIAERQGRAQDKETAHAMQQLRALGYM